MNIAYLPLYTLIHTAWPIKYFVYEHILSQPLKVVIPPMMHSLIQLSQLRVFRSQTQKLDSYVVDGSPC